MVGDAMVETPWGNSSELRARRLRPGPGTAREDVARNQRERLMAAVVAAVEERGCAAVTVADLVEISGVSRSTFYAHFANKDDCLQETVREIVSTALGVVGSRYRGERDWEERARDALGTFFGLLTDQPAASRLVLVESYAAGPDAVALVEDATAGFERLAREAVAQMPGREGMPAEMVQAVIGGLREVVQARLRRHREGELLELASDLLEAALAYRSPPRPLPPPSHPPSQRADSEPNGTSAESDPAERIVAAATRTIATSGYSAATLEMIAGEAAVSLSTFYNHFDGKEDVLAGALDAGQARMFAAAGPAYRRARDWPQGVQAAVVAIFRFLAREPDFARLGMVEVFGAGRVALERRGRMTERLQRFLAAGFELRPEIQGIDGELAVGAAMALVYEQVRSGGGANLPDFAPLATFIVLSPFLGPEEACAVACQDHLRESTNRR